MTPSLDFSTPLSGSLHHFVALFSPLTLSEPRCPACHLRPFRFIFSWQHEISLLFDSVRCEVPNETTENPRFNTAKPEGRRTPRHCPAGGCDLESALHIGRVGPLRLLPRQHITAQQTYLAAMKRYRGNSSVSFLAYANEGVRGSDPQAITEKELAPGGDRHYAFADERKLLAIVEEELERRWKESGNDPWTQHQLGRCSEGLPRFKARRRSLLAQKDDGRALSSGSPEGVSGDEGKGGPNADYS